MLERWQCPKCGRWTRLLMCLGCDAEKLQQWAPYRIGSQRLPGKWATRCKRCGMELTDAASKTRGYGPTCWLEHLAEVDQGPPAVADEVEPGGGPS